MAARVFLRPMGTPLPLGFFAFGTGTMMFTALELAWIPQSSAHSVAILMIAFVAPLELVPALFAFAARDAAAAATLGIFGATWAGVGTVMLANPVGATDPALGFFLLTVSVFIAALAVPSLFGKPVFTAVLGLAVARFVLTGVYQLGGEPWAQTASGWVGIPLALAALYGGLALLMEDVQKTTILPLFRRGSAKAAIERGVDDQLDDIENEAGVREQL